MEKKKELFGKVAGLLVLLSFVLVNLGKSFACEACNRLFLAQLQGSDRAGSLVSQELLATIAAQEALLRSSGAAISPSPAALPRISDPQAGSGDFVEIIRRDNRLSAPPTSLVPQDSKPDKYVRITLQEGDSYIGNGVMYQGFTIDGKIPGPTIIVDEGDIVSFTIVNDGDLPHGASIHAAYTQTSKYLGKIEPGDSATIVFRTTVPGVYMYHCAPGGHAIPMHIIFGQYGMMVVKPRKKFEMERQLGRGPDIELYLLQHEFYASGKDAVDGQGRPMYTAFNGKLFRYVEEPIVGKPGDYVRVNFLNAGPNLLSTFHLVGIVWDYVYWQGHPDNRFAGGQTVTAGPSDSWVIEFRIPPDEGAYLMLSHAVGSTDRGAIGLLVADAGAETPLTVLSDGPEYSEEQMDEFRQKALRTITPFGIGTEDVDVPVIYGPDTEEVIIRIIGNSYHPKVVQVAPGTRIRWINEDVFTYMEGEFSGIHNVIVKSGPERFASDMLAHAESHTQILTVPGEYVYICTPHPYMEGKIIVKEAQSRELPLAMAGRPANSKMVWFVLIVAAFALMIALISLINK
jgi:nitrite reductase (NO-forming)